MARRPRGSTYLWLIVEVFFVGVEVFDRGLTLSTQLNPKKGEGKRERERERRTKGEKH